MLIFLHFLPPAGLFARKSSAFPVAKFFLALAWPPPSPYLVLVYIQEEGREEVGQRQGGGRTLEVTRKVARPWRRMRKTHYLCAG